VQNEERTIIFNRSFLWAIMDNISVQKNWHIEVIYNIKAAQQ